MTASAPERPGRTAIVVVTYGAHALLEENLATIDLAALDADVVVVDNFHSAAERSAVAEHRASARLDARAARHQRRLRCRRESRGVAEAGCAVPTRS